MAGGPNYFLDIQTPLSDTPGNIFLAVSFFFRLNKIESLNNVDGHGHIFTFYLKRNY